MKEKPPASCLIKVVENIVEAQAEANDFSKLPVWERCDPIKRMIPVIFSGCDGPLELFGALECKQSFSTCVFVIEDFNKESNCVEVRLMKPCSVVCPHGNGECKCDGPKGFKRRCVLIPTPYHSTVDLSCLCGIQCLSPSLIIQEMFKTEKTSDQLCCKVVLHNKELDKELWRSGIKNPINGTVTFDYRIGDLPFVELVIERAEECKEVQQTIRIEKGECKSITVDQIKAIRVNNADKQKHTLIGEFKFQLSYCEKELVTFKL